MREVVFAAALRGSVEVGHLGPLVLSYRHLQNFDKSPNPDAFSEE